jgi:putative redox protein
MATDSLHRSVSIERTGPTQYSFTNDRGVQLTVGTSDGPGFTPVELLMAAIGACTAIDVDILTSRRAEPESFAVDVDANKVRDEGGNHLADIEVTFRVRFPEGEAGDAARALLPDAARKSHDRLCTVGRTIEIATPIATHIK